jgi:formiminotetrahydrofolate cyclodeaminase
MTDALGTQSIDTFLTSLASSAPTPGGGSVSALTGAMAAGLVSMVCSITLNKNSTPEEDRGDISALLDQAEALRLELQTLAQEDIDVFHRLAEAYKLPRTTDADAASRQAAIQKLTHDATDVPLRIAHASARLLPLCIALVNRCSRLLVSDIGVAATLARATTQNALLNVEINLSMLEDKNFVREVQMQIEDLTVGLVDETRGVLEIVLERIRQ